MKSYFLPLSILVSIVLVGFSNIGLSSKALADEAPKPSEKAEKILSKYERTGEFVSCLNIRNIDQIRALDDRHFLVRVSPTKYYLNVTPNRCSGASRGNNRLQYTTSIARLCRNEIVRVIDNNTGIFSGACGLSDFERLEKKTDTNDDEPQ